MTSQSSYRRYKPAPSRVLCSTTQVIIEGLWVWYIHSALCHIVNGIVLAPVYWNASNPLFKASFSRPVVQVNLYDEIDFVCPHVPFTSSNSAVQDEVTSLETENDEVVLLHEYYVIYQVTRDQYEACYVDIGRPLVTTMIVNCSNPHQRRRFTLLFEPFQSIPNAAEYVPGGLYYYITTSTGRLEGLLNTYRGACHYQNMRLILRVCCEYNGDDYDQNDYELVDDKMKMQPSVIKGADKDTRRRSKNNAQSKPERLLTGSRSAVLHHYPDCVVIFAELTLAVILTVTTSCNSCR